MDELGSALRHSDEPNFRVSPFLFMPDGTFESAVRLFIIFIMLCRFLRQTIMTSVVVCDIAREALLHFDSVINLLEYKIYETFWSCSCRCYQVENRRNIIYMTNPFFLFSFSILWPTQNVEKGDECTRDFLFGIGEDKQRSARLTAWFHTPENYFIQVIFSLTELPEAHVYRPLN